MTAAYEAQLDNCESCCRRRIKSFLAECEGEGK